MDNVHCCVESSCYGDTTVLFFEHGRFNYPCLALGAGDLNRLIPEILADVPELLRDRILAMTKQILADREENTEAGSS